MIPDSVGDAFSFVFAAYMVGMFVWPVLLFLVGRFYRPKIEDSYSQRTFLSLKVGMAVLFAGSSLALALLITLGHNPLELPTTIRFRIALLIFAILQIPIAALRFSETARGMGNGTPAPQAVGQFFAVLIASGTSGWLEALFFA